MSPCEMDLVTFASHQKRLAEDRVRICQTFLMDELLTSSLSTSLKDSLESILGNAEQDLGSCIHIITMIKQKNEREAKQKETTNKKDKELKVCSSPGPMCESDEFLSTLTHEEIAFGEKKFEQPREDHNDDEQGQNTDDEEQEHQDTQKELDRPSEYRRSSISSRRYPTMGGSSMARSLPMTVPVPPPDTANKRPPPLIPEDDELKGRDIHSSIQLIAKSLHSDSVMGELPKAPKLFNIAE